MQSSCTYRLTRAATKHHQSHNHLSFTNRFCQQREQHYASRRIAPISSSRSAIRNRVSEKSLSQRPRHKDASTNARTITSNPPSSTRPPVLGSTKREEGQSRSAWLWKLVRAYGTFYKTGVKAIFKNRKLATEVKRRLRDSTGLDGSWISADRALLLAAIAKRDVTRSEYQLLKRNAHDMVRVPVFGLMFLALGEWLPLIVPFMPYLPPLTCRIPSQVGQMRQKTEDRRRWMFRQALKEPDKQQLREIRSSKGSDKNLELQMAAPDYVKAVVRSLTQDQLFHLSCALNLHGRVWDTMQLRPPTMLLHRKLALRLAYLAQDDLLMSRGSGVRGMEADELAIACEERGMDVLGPSQDALHKQLDTWLSNQRASKGDGTAMLGMLFRRPNAWAAF